MDLVVVAVGPCVWSKTDQATEFLCVVSSAIWTCFISQNTSYIMYSNSLLCSLQIRHGPIKSRQLHFTNADPRRWRSPTQKKVSKYPISILISVSQKPFYVYQVKHDFLQIPGSGFNSSQVCSTQIIGRQQRGPTRCPNNRTCPASFSRKRASP